MKVLSYSEVTEVSGGNPGFLPAIAAMAVVFKQAYETATWYGAAELGVAISEGWSYYAGNCGRNAEMMYGN